MAKKGKSINGVDKVGELIDFGKPQVVSRLTCMRKEIEMTEKKEVVNQNGLLTNQLNKSYKANDGCSV
jgi:hypothetical protein